MDKNNFEKVSDKMTATLSEDKVEEFVKLLQEKFNDSVSLSPSQYGLIKGEIAKKTPRTKAAAIIPLQPNKGSVTEQLELEALALELELKLLNFAA